MGIKEQIIFPEIDYDKIDKVRGMDISIVTSTDNEDHAFELLKGFNLPFTKGVLRKSVEVNKKDDSASLNQSSKVSSESNKSSQTAQPDASASEQAIVSESLESKSEPSPSKSESEKKSVSESSEAQSEKNELTENKGE